MPAGSTGPRRGRGSCRSPRSSPAPSSPRACAPRRARTCAPTTPACPTSSASRPGSTPTAPPRSTALRTEVEDATAALAPGDLTHPAARAAGGRDLDGGRAAPRSGAALRVSLDDAQLVGGEVPDGCGPRRLRHPPAGRPGGRQRPVGRRRRGDDAPGPAGRLHAAPCAASATPSSSRAGSTPRPTSSRRSATPTRMRASARRRRRRRPLPRVVDRRRARLRRRDAGTPDLPRLRRQHHPRPRRGHRLVTRRLVGWLGELLITAGVLVLLFVAWQLWWTDVTADRAAGPDRPGAEPTTSARRAPRSAATPSPTSARTRPSPSSGSRASAPTTPAPSSRAPPARARPGRRPLPGTAEARARSATSRSPGTARPTAEPFHDIDTLRDRRPDHRRDHADRVRLRGHRPRDRPAGQTEVIAPVPDQPGPPRPRPDHDDLLPPQVLRHAALRHARPARGGRAAGASGGLADVDDAWRG